MKDYISKKEAIKRIGVTVKGIETLDSNVERVGNRVFIKKDLVETYQKILEDTLYPKQINYKLLRHQGYETLEELLDQIGAAYITPKDLPGLLRTRIYKSEIHKINDLYQGIKEYTDQKREEGEYEKYLSQTKDLVVNSKAPVSTEEYHKFVRLRLNNVKNIALTLIGIEVNMIQILKNEIFLIDQSEIQKLLLMLKTQKEKQEFASFINHMKLKWDLSFKLHYSRDEKTIGVRTKGRYKDHEWQNFAELLFVKSEKQWALMERAINNRTCAMIYLYCALHFVCGMRSENFMKYVNHVNLQAALKKTNQEVHQLIKSYNFTEAMAKSIVSQLVNDFSLYNKNPSKTYRKSNTVINLEVSESFVYVIGELLAICEIHRAKSGKKKLIELNIRDVRLHDKLFQGIENDALGDNFYSSRANKSYLHFLKKQAKI